MLLIYMMILGMFGMPYELGGQLAHRKSPDPAPSRCVKCGRNIDRTKDVCDNCGRSTSETFSPLGWGFIGDLGDPIEPNFVDDIYGLDFGVVGTGHRRVVGVQCATVYRGADEIYGLCLGGLTAGGKPNGIFDKSFGKGYSGYGISAAGLYNSAAEFSGVEFAWFVNHNYSSDFLIQGSGWYSGSKDSVALLQFGGFGSMSDDAVASLQAAGLYSCTHHAASIIQVSGIYSHVERATAALQLAGLVNLAESASCSLQFSPFGNRAFNSDFALQIGGGLNGVGESACSIVMGGAVCWISKTAFALQVNAYNSLANDSNGFQIGVYNLMENAKGLQIGLINRTDHMTLPFVNFAW